jgi:uncharacterized membrane protein YgcG
MPRATALMIVDRSNTIFVSSISGFEIATKVSLGKLPGAEWISRAFVTLCADFDFIELPVNSVHAVMAGEFSVCSQGPVRPRAGGTGDRRGVRAGDGRSGDGGAGGGAGVGVTDGIRISALSQ